MIETFLFDLRGPQPAIDASIPSVLQYMRDTYRCPDYEFAVVTFNGFRNSIVLRTSFVPAPNMVAAMRASRPMR